MTIERTGADRSYSLIPSADTLSAELGGDVAAEIAASMLLSAKDSRDSAADARLATEREIAVTEKEQIRQLHARAEDVREAGRYEAVGKIAGAGFQFVAAPFGDTTAGTRLKSTGQLLGASGELFAAESSFEASVHEERAARAEQAASRERRALEGIEDTKDAASDLARNAVELLQSMREVEDANNQAAIYLRG